MKDQRLLYATHNCYPLYKAPLNLSHKCQYGLFGGSFNPIHSGHIAVANYALKTAKLDQIIWLVTPRNPFKDPLIYRPYPERFSGVEAHADRHQFIISDLENRLQPHNSFETLRYLTSRYPKIKFSFILGSDGASHLHKWHFFERLVKMVSFVIIVRPTHRFNVRQFPALRYFKQHHITYQIVLRPFYHISSTQIRQEMDSQNS